MLGGGGGNGEEVTHITSKGTSKPSNLFSSHEEADTKMIFHAIDADQSWGQFLFINSKFHSNSFLSIPESIPIPLVLRKVNSNSTQFLKSQFLINSTKK